MVRKMQSESNDIIFVKIWRTGQKEELNLVGSYWDVKDEARYTKIVEELKRIIQQNNYAVLVGDYNAHLFEMDGRKNKNGDKLREVVEDEGLIMVNKTQKFKGYYTWERNGVRTVIDYAMVKENDWERVVRMEVDEDRKVDVKSGHKMICIELGWKGRFVRKEKNKEVKRNYYSKNQKDLNIFA